MEENSTIEIKRELGNGETLTFFKYQLSDGVADHYRRQRGSYEIMIWLTTPIKGEKGGSRTKSEEISPAVSWYVEEEELRKRFEEIGTREEFYSVRDQLRKRIGNKKTEPEVEIVQPIVS